MKMRSTDRTSSVRKLVAPESIAVLGASQKPGIGGAIVENLISSGYQGRLYAVNVRGEDVLQAKGYASVLDIPEPIDMAIIALPSRFVLDVADECGRKGVRALTCITAGFKEVGNQGAEQEKELLELLHKYGMCMIGPNCMGVLNTAPHVQMNATINPKPPQRGNVAMLTQSGALGAALMDFAQQLGIGFSTIVSVGNQADLNVCDFLELLETDPHTDVVLLYLETISEPQRFRALMQKMTKPVVVLKSGRTAAGAKAAGSHTGSLAGSDAVAQALLRQSGAIRTESLEDAFLLTAVLSKIRKKQLTGCNIGIVSNTGGLGILMTDALTGRGFALPELPQSAVDALRPQLLPEASFHNPIDLVAPATPAQYDAAVQEMLKTKLYDALIITCVPAVTVDPQKVAAAMIDTLKASPIPVFSCFFGPGAGAGGQQELKKQGLLCFEYPETIAELLAYLKPEKPLPVLAESVAPTPVDATLCQEVLSTAQPGQFLGADACQALLSAAGIPLARAGYLKNRNQAACLGLRYPLVAKIDHEKIVHKSDAGGVRLNIANAQELAALWDEWVVKFPGLRGILVQEQVTGSIEVILGATYDPVLGHAVLSGLGGTLVELFQDVSFGHVPLSEQDALRMLHSLKCWRLLEGYRGEAGANIAQLVQLILQLSALLSACPQIRELDLNPLIYDRAQGQFYVVDSRVRL